MPNYPSTELVKLLEQVSIESKRLLWRLLTQQKQKVMRVNRIIGGTLRRVGLVGEDLARMEVFPARIYKSRTCSSEDIDYLDSIGLLEFAGQNNFVDGLIFRLRPMTLEYQRKLVGLIIDDLFPIPTKVSVNGLASLRGLKVKQVPGGFEFSVARRLNSIHVPESRKIMRASMLDDPAQSEHCKVNTAEPLSLVVDWADLSHKVWDFELFYRAIPSEVSAFFEAAKVRASIRRPYRLAWQELASGVQITKGRAKGASSKAISRLGEERLAEFTLPDPLLVRFHDTPYSYERLKEIPKAVLTVLEAQGAVREVDPYYDVVERYEMTSATYRNRAMLLVEMLRSNNIVSVKTELEWMASEFGLKWHNRGEYIFGFGFESIDSKSALPSYLERMHFCPYTGAELRAVTSMTGWQWLYEFYERRVI
ncbi:hypothetical protein [Thaumasiovibrio sp. DFM-14]|uniref:hypothetical protein n=1 Tax=Thaumasiovibrio sp. DFM-14 TaxID=3384792 RepID=UPI00399F55C4